MNQDVYVETHTNYQCSHGIVPQSVGQQPLYESNKKMDNMEQNSTLQESFHTNVSTQRMPDTILQEQAIGNAKSNETVDTEVNMFCENNLCQVSPISTDHETKSYMQYDAKLNPDIGWGNLPEKWHCIKMKSHGVIMKDAH